MNFFIDEYTIFQFEVYYNLTIKNIHTFFNMHDTAYYDMHEVIFLYYYS